MHCDFSFFHFKKATLALSWCSVGGRLTAASQTMVTFKNPAVNAKVLRYNGVSAEKWFFSDPINAAALPALHLFFVQQLLPFMTDGEKLRMKCTQDRGIILLPNGIHINHMKSCFIFKLFCIFCLPADAFGQTIMHARSNLLTLIIPSENTNHLQNEHIYG